MPEYVTNCPKCHQRILGDTNYMGKRVACPVCLQEITLPQPVVPQPGVPEPDESPAPAQPSPGMSGQPRESKPNRLPVVVAAAGLVFLAAAGVIWWLKFANSAPSKAPLPASANNTVHQAGAAATRIAWQSPTRITTAEATLLLRGEVVGAVGFGLTASRTVNLPSLKITFEPPSATGLATTTGTASTGRDNWRVSAGIHGTGNADFDAVLNGFNYDGGPKTITLYHLIPGRQYAVQLFALDNRDVNDAKDRKAWFSDPLNSGDVSATFKMSDDVYVVGVFTATSNSRQIIENLPGTAPDVEG
ncbi:MAG TPA: hypothetical protein VF988_06300 [Verrucomicrobiae bacterium]